jgi:hypothetical protein
MRVGAIFNLALPFFDNPRLTVVLAGLAVKGFMKMLTGWQLVCPPKISNITLKTGQNDSLPEKIREARVMVWERQNDTGKDLQLLVQERRTGGKYKSVGWLSASRE